MTAIVHLGDSRAVLAGLEPCSVDAVVTDPPYELAFMGRKWDSTGIAFDPAFWGAVLRVLKPGGHLLAFGGTRTYHRMAVAIEDAGFEIRDSLHWCYTQGFPKSLDVSKAIDAAAGVERDIVGYGPPKMTVSACMSNSGQNKLGARKALDAGPATEAARQWSGWGTALKPAHEPIVLARRPLDGTVAANVLKWGTGGVNVDGCRIDSEDKPMKWDIPRGGIWKTDASAISELSTNALGRWPPNLLLGHHPDCGQTCVNGCAVAEFNKQTGVTTSGTREPYHRRTVSKFGGPVFNDFQEHGERRRFAGDSGGGARMLPCFEWADEAAFRYCPKPSRAEREAGCQGLPTRSGAEAVDREEGSAGMGSPRAGAGRTADQIANTHTTVKPISLMRWLCRLITPPGGTVLDPFTGSGTTGCGAVLEDFAFVGIEREAEYHAIAEARIAYWARQSPSHRAKKPTAEDPQQIRLFG